MKTGELYIREWWWVLLFMGCCYAFHSYAMHHKEETITTLVHKEADLRAKKEVALELREELRLQVESQSDPSWIEMTLMKGLGVVPENQRKVYFEE